jgi:2,4-dienoyl-CoA reductase-like NADH-dependent reductase (Old Yellow Enzyme family)
MTTLDGHMTDRLYAIYEKLAEGEAGLIITGYANVVSEERPNPGMMGIYDDSFLEEYKKLTSAVHKYDSRIILQIAYGGTKSTHDIEERTIFAPSSVPERSTGTSGKPMTKEEIDYIVGAFASAAKRARDSGFDGIEIHAAHTYLINQFLSPYYNRRTDQYGGSLENRMRFLIEIYNEMRTQTSEEFPILVKLTASEFFEGGLTFDETKLICQKMEEIGVDGLEISGNIHGKAKSMVGEYFDGYELKNAGYFSEYGKFISHEVDIPVITVGGLSNPDHIETLLNETGIDFFGLSRPLLAEPDLFKRWKSGDRNPAKCIRCSKCRTPEGNYCTVFPGKQLSSKQ